MHIRTTDNGREHRRELVIDEQAVSWLTIIDYQIRIGSTQVSMAGIGGVETHREQRMKGYMRALSEDSLAYVVDRGYDVSMLFGISDFYNKFGYASCLPSYKLAVKTRDAEDAQRDAGIHTVRPIEPADMGAVLALYNQNNAHRTCSIVRTWEHFPAFPKGSWWGVPVDSFLLEDDDGQLVAYAVFDRTRRAVTVVEVESTDTRFFPTLLYEFAKMAIERRCEQITLFMPPDHPFAEYVQRYGCTWTIECSKNGGGVMRIINQKPLLEKIVPELENRIMDSQLVGHTAGLAMNTDLGTTTLKLEDCLLFVDSGAPTESSIDLSQDKLMQLICGYRSARDVLNDPDVKTSGAIIPWLDTLFPKGHPYVWLADHF